jgi:hypothetical protein
MSVDASPSVTRIALEACFEFFCYAAPAATDGFPLEPGQIQCAADGRATLLHFAPRRWLVPSPSAALHTRLADLENRGRGALIDVDGKWQMLRIADAAGILGRSINVEALLRNRQCAAGVVFDCPVILARGASVDLWVASSYLDSLLAAVVGE